MDGPNIRTCCPLLQDLKDFGRMGADAIFYADLDKDVPGNG